MKLVSTTLFLILIAASPAFSLLDQDNKTTSDEPNFKTVNGFSGYLTLDDYPHDHVQRWLDPVEIAILSAMPTMRRVRLWVLSLSLWAVSRMLKRCVMRG